MPTQNTTSDLVILDIQESQEETKQENYFSYLRNLLFKGASIKLRQKVIFFRIMATMVNASLTVLKSLSALKKQEKEKNMIKFYNFMIDRVQ